MSVPVASCRRCFSDLRSVRWRMGLGILPSSSDAPVEALRRAVADSRRRYASLRRRILSTPQNDACFAAIDDPLSQNPESAWGLYFQSAEMEKRIGEDVSLLDGLEAEEGTCSSSSSSSSLSRAALVMRRVLLLWARQHPELGYRQGMHELLFPLTHALLVDLDCLSQLRQRCGQRFTDGFDKLPSLEIGTSLRRRIDDNYAEDEMDLTIREMIELTDAYGADGELGALLSVKFMEHDLYSMFDSLMGTRSGNDAVVVAEFFAPPANVVTSSEFQPVIEASRAIYHVLAAVDASLHSHLIELGVEPQYFALRWLRVLFGREFGLGDLLHVWDEVFECSNDAITSSCDGRFKLLCSHRGAFIASMAVAMLVHVRSSLLATEITTVCLQRLMSFPKDVDVRVLTGKAKALLPLALHANSEPSLPSPSSIRSAEYLRRQPLPANYWEEKWQQRNAAGSKSSVRRRLLEELNSVPADEKSCTASNSFIGDSDTPEFRSEINSDEPSSAASSAIASEEDEDIISSCAASAGRCGNADFADDNRTFGSRKTLAETVLENVQIVESALQSERGGEGTSGSSAKAALENLRAIAELLMNTTSSGVSGRRDLAYEDSSSKSSFRREKATSDL